MAEYTFKNIIIDPTKEGIESLIGKEVYVSNIPSFCLDYANDNEYSNLGVLTELNINDSHPFVVKHGSCSSAYICIIPKEPKNKYVPFESMDEFLERYTESKERAEFGSFEGKLNQYGMWLKDKDRDVYCLVTEIWNYGVVVGDSNMHSTQDGDEYFTFNGVTKWKRLLMEYTFLDDTPCGKEVEE